MSIFAVTALANAQSASLALGSGAGAPGSNVTVSLALSTGGTQPAALQWTLQYSPADITGVTASIGASASSAGKSLTCTTATGSVMCVIFGLNQSIIADGTVAQLTFTVAPGTTSTSSPIQVTQVVLSDSTGTSIPVSVSGGSISVVQAPVVVSALSCSPATLSPGGNSTCVVTLNKPALGSGAAVAISSNNASVSAPASVSVTAGATTATFTATAGSFISDSSAQITASLNGGSASSSLTLTALAQISAVSCTPASLNPNGQTTCVVNLSKSAPASGAVIGLSSNSTSVSVAASITATAGTSAAGFTATVGSFTSDSSAQITASLNSSAASASLTLTSLAQISALGCTPASLNPNGKSTCGVTLSKPAPASGAAIALSSNSASVSVPASVTANAGANTVSFTATAGAFANDGSAQITASLNGQSQSFPLTLKASTQIQITSITCSPATFNGGSSSTCKVTLSGAPTTNGSIALSSNAANVTVPSSVAITSGHTSAQFNATSILVDIDANAVLTASFGGSSQSTTLTVIGVRPTVLACSPLTLSAGGSATCTVQLNRAPQTRNLTLVLASNSASIQVPQSLSTKNQQTQYNFTARAAKFAAPGPVQISATYLTSVAIGNISVLAPAAPALAAPTKMTTTVGTAMSITAQAEDLSGLNVNLSADNLPDGASFTIDSSSTTSPATAAVSGVIQWVPTADQIGTYSINLGAHSAVGTTSQKVTIQVAAQVPHIDAVVNAASLSTQQVCSPGSLAVIQGTALQIPAPSNGSSANRTSVAVNGVPTGILNASPTQITFRCPESINGQKFTLQVSNRFGASNSVKISLQDAAPGIFTIDGSGTGQGVVYVNGTNDFAALPDPTFAGQPAASGDTLTLLMTGLPKGPLASSVARVTIGQIPAEVLSVADVPLYPGLQMLTVSVPQGVPVGDSVPVQVFSQGQGSQSNTVTVAIEQADQ